MGISACDLISPVPTVQWQAVKTVKWLLSKCSETGQSEFLALLDWQNTPTEGLGSSPALRFFGRRYQTQLPMTETPHVTQELMPGHSTTIGRLTICPHFELERLLECSCQERRGGLLAYVLDSMVHVAMASEWAKLSIAETGDTYSKEEKCLRLNRLRSCTRTRNDSSWCIYGGCLQQQ